MNIQQLYTNCLAQGAYYISNNGEAAIIDPLRDTKPYLELLKQNNDTLKYIFETHFHADFVSGHVDLADKTQAQIVFGPNADTSYKSHIASDGETFSIGNLTLSVLHTPGHTLESTCYLLRDPNKKPICIFTGDTLFIGDVGRPDLAIKTELSQEDLAGMLYDSLRLKIIPLPDDIIVYPAHGAGSACGKNMSKETSDTLGNQKKHNYALQNISKKAFIEELTTGILPAPQYFAKNASLNKHGYSSFDTVLQKGYRPLGVNEFEEGMKLSGSLVLDVRSADDFAKDHIPGSIFIGLDGQFAPWVGTLIQDINAPILLVTPPGREEESVMRLSRVGYDNCIGYLQGGLPAWISAGKSVKPVNNISAESFIDSYSASSNILDVRKPGEFDSGHLKRADSKALDFIDEWVNAIDSSNPYIVHCAGGYRSMIAISILERNGFSKLTNVLGGFGAISKLDKAKAEIVSNL